MRHVKKQESMAIYRKLHSHEKINSTGKGNYIGKYEKQY